MRTRNGDAANRRRRRALLMAAAVAVEALPVWLRAHKPGGKVIVRCRQGHLFTTIWMPGVSAKSLRLGFWRVQYCPVGRHWTIVAPVREAGLSDDQRRTAHEQHDIRIP